ncbi:hypothetical protein L6452_32282 [Arctium lappa]|uniref:Uncharacterized protein n=1 Tax=Arctium lappa TaxID=4217 RepID=A0ACB8Z438_ARCLA|nr:hypothetical protein L6452_32282 [Arctium lappa]
MNRSFHYSYSPLKSTGGFESVPIASASLDDILNKKISLCEVELCASRGWREVGFALQGVGANVTYALREELIARTEVCLSSWSREVESLAQSGDAILVRCEWRKR